MNKWAAYDKSGEYLFDFRSPTSINNHALAEAKIHDSMVEYVELVSDLDEEPSGRGGA